MKRFIILVLVVSMFCSPLVSSVYAGKVQSQQISQEEAESMSSQEVESAPLVATVEGGGAGGVVIGALLAVVIIAIIAAGNS